MKLLVTGGGGMLGAAVDEAGRGRGWTVHAPGHRDLDVTDPERCRRVMGEGPPEVVVHCAAYTAVDDAESAPERAMHVNRDGTRNVLEAAAEVGAKVIYPSTDYVFDGRATHPYLPDDPPHPLSAYGRSKLAGEVEIRNAPGAHLVVRTSWLYGRGGRNFVDTIRALASEGRELRVVADQHGRPTWAGSLAQVIVELIECHATGTVHACDGGSATWFDLAQAVIDLTGLSAPLVPVSTAEYGAAASRPAYSVLDLAATESLLRRRLPHWRNCLETYLGGPT
jgi:dTDP-4-dehydrorhamnose reductase